MRTPKGMYSRKYLPHLDAGAVPQFITWRLADSLPSSLLEQWRRETSGLEEPERKGEMYRRVESFLDAGHGSRLLRNAPIASAVVATLFHDHGRRFELAAFVVMPTHVHVLLTPKPEVPLDAIVRILKGQSALKINALRGQSGRLWQPDYYDRMIRDEDHFRRAKEYVEWNPVKANLCLRPSDWPWSSAARPVV
jgi:REP element-mobilizing transposase RayT